MARCRDRLRTCVSTLLAILIAAGTAIAEAPSAAVAAEEAYVASGEQLVVELYVRNVKDSAAFYEKLGFKRLRGEPTFVELGWEQSRLFLEQIAGQPAPPATLVANIRIMVPDVDRYWKTCQEMQLPVKRAIGNRYYGLRDFTVVSPDGVGLRFASLLSKNSDK